MRYLKPALLLMLVIVSGVMAAGLINNQQEPAKLTDTTDGTVEKSFVPDAGDPPAIHGWIPHWNINDGIDTMEQFPDFSSVSPVWYEVGAEGALLPVGDSLEALQTYTAQTGVLLIPSIASFDHNTFSSLAATDELLSAHIDAILDEVDSKGYDGIDLDYESIKLDDARAYMTLISTLAEELHNRDKILSVTVLPKWGDNVLYGYRPETRMVQQWDQIARYADQVRIMTYDYTYQGTQFPGPIAPEAWIRDVAEYAQEKMPAEKITLGVPTYAYEWFREGAKDEAELRFEPNGLTNPEAELNKARSYTYDTVEKILTTYSGTSQDFEGETIYRYSKGTEDRVVVFLGPRGVLSRYKIAEEYGLGGISFWSLGGDQNLYNSLADYLAKDS